jgi:hypothetical protein
VVRELVAEIICEGAKHESKNEEYIANTKSLMHDECISPIDEQSYGRSDELDECDIALAEMNYDMFVRDIAIVVRWAAVAAMMYVIVRMRGDPIQEIPLSAMEDVLMYQPFNRRTHGIADQCSSKKR